MIRKLLIIVCLLSTVSLTYGQKKKKRHQKEDAKVETAAVTDAALQIDYKTPGAPMPPVRFVKDDGSIITNRSLSASDKVLIMMYNPTCEHCQEEAKIIKENLSLFKKTKILFMAAPNMKDYFTFFENVTKIAKHPEINVGLDSSGFIDKTFTYQSLPQINIYDKDRKLVKVFTGDVPIDSLKPYLD